MDKIQQRRDIAFLNDLDHREAVAHRQNPDHPHHHPRQQQKLVLLWRRRKVCDVDETARADAEDSPVAFFAEELLVLRI